LISDAMRAANRLQRLEKIVVGGADAIEKSLALGALYIGKSQKKVLGGDEIVAEVARVFLGAVEDLVYLARKRRLGVRLLRVARHLPADGFAELRDADTKFLEYGNDDSFVLGEEGEEKMKVVDERIAGASRQVDGLVQRFRSLYCKTIRINHLAELS
jgi:hypothetical protein